MAYIPVNNLAYPVLLEAGNSFGSGFHCFTDDAVFLVTAQHNLFGPNLQLRQKIVGAVFYESDLITKIEVEIDCEKAFQKGQLRKSNSADVAVIKIGKTSGDRINFSDFWNTPSTAVNLVGAASSGFSLLKDIEISNDVVLFGYPTSLSAAAQIDKTRPLLRRGCIAGITEDNRIVVDCPSYFGNSGGLVIEVKGQPGNREYNPVGVAVRMIPFAEELWSKQFNTQVGTRYENSGYTLVEPMDKVIELLD